MEKQLTREEQEIEMPLVSRPETPTRGQVEEHNATDATFHS